MAGTRQYGGLNTIPFDIFPTPGTGAVADADTTATTGTRRQGTTLDQFPTPSLNGEVRDWTAAELAAQFTTLNVNAANQTLLNITGEVSFNKPAGVNYRLHVIRNVNFRWDPGVSTTAGGFFSIVGSSDTDTNGQGVHIIFVNCSFTAFNPSSNTGGNNNVWITTNRNATDASASGYSPTSRPIDLTNRSLVNSRSFNFIGCTVALGTNNNVARRYRMTAADVRESLFIDPFSNTAATGNFTFVYSQPGGLIENSLITSHGSFTAGLGPERMWLTGPTSIVNSDTRGYTLAVADAAQVEVFGLQGIPGLAVSAFHAGNAPAVRPNDNRTYMKSIDPVFAIPDTIADRTITYTDNSTNGTLATQYRANARYIELMRYRPEFHATVTDADPTVDAMHVRATYGITFAGRDNYVTATNASDTTVYDYFTSTNGRIDGNGHRPDLGDNDTLDGLVIPVASYQSVTPATNNDSESTRLTYGDSNITVRGFWNDVPEADGETNLLVNRAALVTRAGNADTAGTSLGLRVESPVDAALGTAATAITPRTVAGINTYFNSTFTGAEAFTDQDVSDGLKALHYQYTADVPFRTTSTTDGVTTASIGSTSEQVNIRYSPTATNGLNWTSSTAANLAGVLTVRGSPAGSAAGQPVTALNVNGNVDFGDQPVIGSNITATTLSRLNETANLNAANGGSLAGAYTPTNPGAVLNFGTDANGVGVDLSGFTSTGAITITGAVAVPPADNTNIDQPAAINLTGILPGSYVAAYRVNTSSLTPLITTNPANGVVTGTTFDVTMLTVGDRVRVAVTSRDHQDFIIDHVVATDAVDNTFIVTQLPQATPADPTDVTGISLTTTTTGNGSDARMVIAITGATQTVVNGTDFLSDTQAYGFLTRAKLTAGYNRLVAELNNTAAENQIFQPQGTLAPGNIRSLEVTIEAASPPFQVLGFVAPVRSGTDTTSVLAPDVDASGTGVFILNSSSFDLPVTVNSITNVVRSQEYIDDVTDPAINAIRNFLQLSDN